MATQFLLALLMGAILFSSVRFLWSRRKLYRASLTLPGPFALPFIGSAFYFIGNPYDIFARITQMFNCYPGIFRVWFGTRMFYAVSDPRYFEILFTSPRALRKEELFRMTHLLIGQGLLSALSVTHWKKHRKLIMPTFNQKILDGFMEVFVKQSEVLVGIMEKHQGEEDVDVFKLISRCTLDIISETAMGVQVEAQTSDSTFPKLADRSMEIIMMRIFNIFYHSDFVFKRCALGKELDRCAHELRAFTKQVLAEKQRKHLDNREPEPEKGFLKRAAFLDLLIEINREGGHDLTDEELLDETMTFMIAGSDTTAATNCFVLTMLGMHRDVQAKVVTELVEVVGTSARVELIHLPQLKYLERVIKETLRIFPLGSFLVRTADEDIDLGDGNVILQGCSIVFGVMRAHRNPKYWPDPLRFDPDRFSPREVAKRPPAAYVPFSYGPRNCIGMKYAMMAMKALLATVLRKYEVSTGYRTVEEIELKSNLVLRPKDGYRVSFTARKPYV